MERLPFILPNLSLVLGVLLALLALLSLSLGGVALSWEVVLFPLVDLFEWSFSAQADPREAWVFWHLRLPRVLLGFGVGAILGLSGAAMQGLFRNPLVEPGLVGISSGAALAAVGVMVFSLSFSEEVRAFLGIYLLPFFAFLGALGATWLTYHLSKSAGRAQTTLLILAGVAINALAGACIGFIIYFADDNSLREFTFWNFGDLGVATWQKLQILFFLGLLPALFLLRYARGLDALALGEHEAYALGFSPNLLRRGILLAVAASVGSAVAFCGAIGFVGLVVPHIVRQVVGARHAQVLPLSALVGALLLGGADLMARTLVQPSELPVGVITALVGAPVFVFLLLRMKNKLALS